ncbi:MAG: copper homeostasis protein CutC [Bacteroidales bacterium]|jgi:copper homeostasis protein|nr:copper homeostasis protein CutC [Bacteroidales bacterium]
MKKNRFLEVCVDAVTNALVAESAGAHRVELCANLAKGGVTPSVTQIILTKKKLKIPVHVLIRPRPGDYLYSKIEFEIMKADINICGEAGCDGVAIGMLNRDGTIDTEGCRELIETARKYGMVVTFHRAFDQSIDLYQSLETVIELGCERILTSGGYRVARAAGYVLKTLIETAEDRTIIMPAAGITPENAEELIAKTGLTEMHGSFRAVTTSDMLYKNKKLNMAGEYNLWKTDPEKIKKVLKYLEEV